MNRHCPTASAAQPASIDRTAPVTRLCNTLDAIFDVCAKFAEPSHSPFFARTLRIALAEAASQPDLLTPAQRESAPDRYRRHLLAADPRGRYAIAALVWLPHQASPVHAHHTWCGYAVLDGVLSETLFTWDDTRHRASETRTQRREAGAISFVRGGRGGIHQLGNRGAHGDRAAVSLHIYGVSGAQIGTHVNDVIQIADEQALA